MSAYSITTIKLGRRESLKGFSSSSFRRHPAAHAVLLPWYLPP